MITGRILVEMFTITMINPNSIQLIHNMLGILLFYLTSFIYIIIHPSILVDTILYLL